ncbi:MAG: class I SAM-dependent methyltransferase [Gemmatimonadaceae bacterium]|jgi:hypothetical protein|nr:class I SAM-dependent methyltransferase [Gemmatimonadaceae bacterium]
MTLQQRAFPIHAPRSAAAPTLADGHRLMRAGDPAAAFVAYAEHAAAAAAKGPSLAFAALAALRLGRADAARRLADEAHGVAGEDPTVRQVVALTRRPEVRAAVAASEVAPSPAMLAQVRTALEDILRLVGFRGLQDLGFHLQRNDFYSPVNDCAFLEANPDLWREPPAVPPDIAWRDDAQLQVLRELAPYVRELDDVPDVAGPDPSAYAWKNGFWENGDALAQYGFVRARKPRRYIEIGSGWSSLLLKRALARNAAEGAPCDVTLVEPHPNPRIFAHLPAAWTHRHEILQRVPLDCFEALGPGDILFYDGSHCAKVASDVNWFFFRVLPRVRPGVLIHLHDISLPQEYPDPWIFERGQTWNEQYVLQAFLMHNRAYEIELANRYLYVNHREACEAAFGGTRPAYGSSFWMRKVTP